MLARPLFRVALALAVLLPVGAGAQVRSEIIRGRVTTDSGAAVAGADVIATMAPNREVFRTTTDSGGRYALTIPNGTGDYLVHISAVGRAAFRKRVTRTGGNSVYTVDATLASAVQKLAAVKVQASTPRPTRGPDFGPEVGASEKIADGVNGAVPPDQAGDLAAIAATVPGVAMTPNGISVLGLDPSQNSMTLNGMAFSGADVPRDVQMSTRVSSSTYDPSRGWFSGANVNVELQKGNLFSSRRGHLTADAPWLQSTDAISSRLGQRVRGAQASLGGNGALTDDDKWFYNAGVQGSRRAAGVTSLLGAGADLLQHAGVSADSAARLVQLLTAAGIPLSTAGVPSERVTDNISLMGRIDRAPYDWKTFTPAKKTWGVTGYAKLARTGALEFQPTATPGHGGDSFQGTGGVQGEWSAYFGKDYLNDTRSGFSYSRNRLSPYLTLPDGRVLVGSSFADGTSGVTGLQFGGNGALDNDLRQWTWETTSETQFYASGKPRHRVKLSADARLDGYAQDLAGNRNGTFGYNSLADLAANQPASFARTLSAPSRSGGEWNGYVAVGDLWRASDRFQLLYGARVEGNRFTAAPAYDAAVDQTFGARTDAAPNTMHVSPRIGFTWLRGGPNDRGQRISVSPVGMFRMGPTAYVRGGIGEFRNMIAPTLLADPSANTGLPDAMQRLACLGPAVPTPDWRRYASDPSAIPAQCAGSASPVFADAAPSVQLVDPSYTAPRSWRGNLAYSSSWRPLRLDYTLEGAYSLNLNQPALWDLNFANAPRFTLPDEGRPMFVSPSSIVPATGTVSPVESRVSSAFGRVLSRRSDLTSHTRQLTFSLTPEIESGRWFASGAYALSENRARLRGFDGPTFDSPVAAEWARGDLDARHQFWLQGGYTRLGLTFTTFARVASGTPFTPIVGSDVNGDGLANDRAFVFDAARAADPALASAMRALLASSSGSVRDCLTRQLGVAAGRNSCQGPWTASLNAQLNVSGNLLHTGRRLNASLTFGNPLGGLDQLLHGSDHLHGWGTTPLPDPVLYQVRGFDPATNRFRYEVNPRFGNTRPSSSTLRAPFRISLDISFDVGRAIPEQQLDRWLKPGRDGRPGPRLSADDLKKRYERNVPDPYSGILEESDSLLLTRDQMEEVQKAKGEYRQRMDSLWISLATYLASLGDTYDVSAALDRQERVTDEAWELTRQDVQRTLKTILTPVQLRILPNWAHLMYFQTTPFGGKNRIRVFINGPM